MRLSFETTILLSVVALLLPGSSAANAQSPVTASGQPKLENVASPLANWQSRQPESSVSIATDEATTTTVVLEVATIAVDLDSDVPLKSFFKRDSFEVHTGSIPAVNATRKLGASRLSNADASPNSPTKSVAGCESVSRSMPVLLAKLDDDGIVKMNAALSTDDITPAPKVTCYSGQTAVVSDMNLRPFVVGVKPIIGEHAVAHQPIIQMIEDGYTFRLNPVVEEGKINLNANLAHSHVSNVESFTFSKTENGGVTVQIPEQTLKQVNVSTALEDGETLFIDPRLQVEFQEKQIAKLPFAKEKTVGVNKQVYFLVTARIVVQEDEHGTSLTLVK